MSQLNDLADKSSVRCLNKDAEEKMINVIDQAKVMVIQLEVLLR